MVNILIYIFVLFVIYFVVSLFCDKYVGERK